MMGKPMPEESNILSDSPSQSGPRVFATTHWSVVLAAKEDDSPSVQEALEKLCRTYWYPIYAYLRRRGCGEQDAQDVLRLTDAGSPCHLFPNSVVGFD